MTYTLKQLRDEAALIESELITFGDRDAKFGAEMFAASMKLFFEKLEEKAP